VDERDVAEGAVPERRAHGARVDGEVPPQRSTSWGMPYTAAICTASP
jgi:hypothetical protein